jgi:penicillin-binding protein 1A
MIGGDWGQGAHNALNIVGDFFQQALKSRLIDPKLRFAAPRQQDMIDPSIGRMSEEWFNSLFQGIPETQGNPEPPLVPESATASAAAQSPAAFADAPLAVLPPPVPEPAPRATRRIEGLRRIFIGPDGVVRVEIIGPGAGQTREAVR